MLFRGARTKMGLCCDKIRGISPHGQTGRADYWGELVNRTARTMAASQPGQMLCTEAFLTTVRAAGTTSTRVLARSLG